jgi:hypothetical protein
MAAWRCAPSCLVSPSLPQASPFPAHQLCTFCCFVVRCNFHHFLCASITATLPPGLGVDGRPKAGRELPVSFAGRGRPQYLGHSYSPCAAHCPAKPSPSLPKQGLASSCDAMFASLIHPRHVVVLQNADVLRAGKRSSLPSRSLNSPGTLSPSQCASRPRYRPM